MPFEQHPTDPDKLVMRAGNYNYNLQNPWVGLTDEDLLTILGGELDSSDEAFLRFGRAVIAHIKQKNT